MDDDDAEVVSAALDLVTHGTVGRLQRLARALGITTSAQRFDAVLAEERAEWVEDRLDALTERLEQLYANSPVEERPTASDVEAVVQAALRIYVRTGDRNKRELLSWAVANAFEPELYKQGLHLRLLRLLDGLEYGDVRLLQKLERHEASVDATYRGHVYEVAMNVHHASVLMDAGLAAKRTDARAVVVITDLGHRMLELLREPPRDDEA